MRDPREYYEPFPDAPSKTIENRHGARVSYTVLGDGPRTILLANGLGARLYTWEPLVRALLPAHRIITWDYRGLFDSTAPERRRHLSVVHHAEDAVAILDAEGVDAAVFCGWSMGVQVTLEAATLHPERVRAMVLINGTYGQVFSTGLQPVLRVPFMSNLEHAAVEYVMDHPPVARAIERVAPAMVHPIAALFWLASDADVTTMRSLFRRYTREIFGEATFPNYLQLFQELDAHSVLHHLRRIQQPALVISGAWDILTPPYQSEIIARRLPHATHLKIRRASHFALMERPRVVVPAVEEFLSTRVAW
jgi:3-oxoadipate enol-lactonase